METYRSFATVSLGENEISPIRSVLFMEMDTGLSTVVEEFNGLGVDVVVVEDEDEVEVAFVVIDEDDEVVDGDGEGEGDDVDDDGFISILSSSFSGSSLASETSIGSLSVFT